MKSNNTSSNSAYMLILLILLILVSCRERVIPPDNGNGVHVPKLKIEAEDIGVTDCFIRLKFLDTSNVQAKIFSLTRDGQTILSSQCSSLDTLILDEGLLPKRTYTYKAYRLLNSTPIDSSVPLTIISMDSSSHNFSWQIDTLGDGAGSVLRDVAILSDTCAWAVGEIYKKDSTGQFETDAYNAARWNGREWKLIRIPTKIWNTNSFMYAPLQSIFTFSEKDICVTTGGSVIWYNGQSWGNDQFLFTSLDDPTFGSINKFWGTSKTNLYGVGNKGNIFFYNGSSWRRLESPEGASVTDVNLTDVWGSPDGKTVFACGWEDFKPTVLLRIKETNCEKIWEELHPTALREDSLSGILGSLWMKDSKRLYIASSHGLYITSIAMRGNARRSSFTQQFLPGFPFRLRGSEINDITLIGEYSMIAHYNGYSWKHYAEFMNPDGRLRSVAQKGNLVVAIGWLYDPFHRRGIVYIGRR